MSDITLEPGGQEQLRDWISKLNGCYLLLGVDSRENIRKIVVTAGEILGGACVLYNRLDEGLLCTWAIWNEPESFKAEDRPEGHICYDVIRREDEGPLLIEDLEGTSYQKTDSNVGRYGLKSYMGFPVKIKERTVGSLCLVDVKKRAFTALDLQIMGILAKAISIEEERREAEDELKKAVQFNREIIENACEGLIVYDRHLNYLVWNRFMEELTGVSSKEALNRNSLELFPHLKEQGIDRLLAKALEGRTVKSPDTPFYSPSTGKKGWVKGIYGPHLNGQGDITGVISVVRDITERKESEENLRKSLKEKELLLKEVYHRVKNNMQIVSSLLRLQAMQSGNSALSDCLSISIDRIRTMALIHEKLYQSNDLTRIDFGQYLGELASSLAASYGRDDITCSVKAEPVHLGINSAIPCALIVNELVTNSLKYAFPDDRQGHIDIELRAPGENTVAITVRDNGIGLPAGVDLQNPSTLGLQLVSSLATQLGTEADFVLEKGTSTTVEFKTIDG
ncbi:MAG: histidine kinase dimerization/phosphoacceptor domain -containing protein [Candidatus Eremiobacteraeota bacterium]|nr:histidine kinase dimerization/phosphoacceptor domain -containing protein [Candidatus Eremiobacteraeota bacterium]